MCMCRPYRPLNCPYLVRPRCPYSPSYPLVEKYPFVVPRYPPAVHVSIWPFGMLPDDEGQPKLSEGVLLGIEYKPEDTSSGTGRYTVYWHT